MNGGVPSRPVCPLQANQGTTHFMRQGWVMTNGIDLQQARKFPHEFLFSDLQLQQCLKNEHLLSWMKLCFSNEAIAAFPLNMRYSILHETYWGGLVIFVEDYDAKTKTYIYFELLQPIKHSIYPLRINKQTKKLGHFPGRVSEKTLSVFHSPKINLRIMWLRTTGVLIFCLLWKFILVWAKKHKLQSSSINAWDIHIQ